MNSNLPMKEETGLFGKIKNFFRNLFYKPVEVKNEEIIINDKEKNIKNIQKEKFKSFIKTDVDNSVYKELERNELFDKIRKNPDLLDTLSSKQLENLSAYYDKVIAKNNEIIKKKKTELDKLKKVS